MNGTRTRSEAQITLNLETFYSTGQYSAFHFVLLLQVLWMLFGSRQGRSILARSVMRSDCLLMTPRVFFKDLQKSLKNRLLKIRKTKRCFFIKTKSKTNFPKNPCHFEKTFSRFLRKSFKKKRVFHKKNRQSEFFKFFVIIVFIKNTDDPLGEGGLFRASYTRQPVFVWHVVNKVLNYR